MKTSTVTITIDSQQVDAAPAAAVFAVGAFSLHYGRKNATDLTAQVLDQTLRRIDLRIQSFLRVAVRQSRLSNRLLETGQLSDPQRPGPWAPTSDDFDRTTAHFAQAMRVHQGLTNLGIGLEATGEFSMVSRKPGGLLSLNYIRDDDGAMRINLYTPLAKAVCCSRSNRTPTRPTGSMTGNGWVRTGARVTCTWSKPSR